MNVRKMLFSLVFSHRLQLTWIITIGLIFFTAPSHAVSVHLDFDELLRLSSDWKSKATPSHPADLDRSGDVDEADLLELLKGWHGIHHFPDSAWDMLQREGIGEITGQILSLSDGQTVASATVSILNTTYSAMTGADGVFTIQAPAPGDVGLRIEAEGYVYAQRKVYNISPDRLSNIGKIYLQAKDSQVTPIDAEQGGTATSSDGAVSVIIPPGAASEDLEVCCTFFPDGEGLPEALPNTTEYTYAVDLDPHGATFSQPVTLEFANDLNIPPGARVPLGYYNEKTMQWEDVGMTAIGLKPGQLMAQVSEDGSKIRCQIDHFSTYDANYPSSVWDGAMSNLFGVNSFNPPKQGRAGGGSSISMKEGSLCVTYALPPLIVNQKLDILHFYYYSNFADPHAMITAEIDNTEQTTFTIDTSCQLEAGGVLYPEVHFGPDVSQGNPIWWWDGRDPLGNILQSGCYPFCIRFTNNFGRQPYAMTDRFGAAPDLGNILEGTQTRDDVKLETTVEGKVPFRNEAESPFGAGWNLDELARVVIDPDGSLMLAYGNGETHVLEPGAELVDRDAFGLLGEGWAEIFRQGVLTGTTDPAGTTYLMHCTAVEQAAVFRLNADRTITKIIDFSDFISTDPGSEMHLVSSAMAADPGQPDKLYIATNQKKFMNSEQLTHLFLLDAGAGTLTELLSSTDLYPAYDLKFDSAGNLYLLTGAIDIMGGALLNAGYGKIHRKMVGEPDFELLYDGYIFPEVMEIDDQDCLYTLAAPMDTTEIDDSFSVIERCLYAFDLFDESVAVDAPISDQPVVIADGFYANFNVLGSYHYDLTRGPNGDLFVLSDSVSFFALNPLDTLPESFRTISQVYPESGRVNTYNTQLRTPIKIFWSARGNMYVTDSKGHLFELAAGWLSPLADFGFTRLLDDGRIERRERNGEQLIFSPLGYLTERIDRNGNKTTYSYNSQNLVKQRTNPRGGKTTFNYDSNGKMKSITDPAGRTTEFEVDSRGDLVRVAFSDQKWIQYEYDGFHRLVKKTEPDGTETTYQYDAAGLCVGYQTGVKTMALQPAIADYLIDALTGDEGSSPQNPASLPRAASMVAQVSRGNDPAWEYQLDWVGAIVKIVGPEGETTTIIRDEAEKPIQVTPPNGRETLLEWDGRGNLTSKWTRGATARFEFEHDYVYNQITSVTTGEGNLYRWYYDDSGNVTEIRDPAGRRAVFVYASGGLLESVSVMDGQTAAQKLQFESDAQGNLAKLTFPLGQTARWERDSTGFFTRYVDPEGGAWKFEYDAKGLLSSAIDPLGAAWEYRNNFAHQVVWQKDPDGVEVSYAYADGDLPLSLISPVLGELFRFEYDAAGRVEKAFQAGEEFIECSYNTSGRLEAVTDALNLRSVFEWTPYDAIDSITTPGGKTTNYGYDTLQRLTTVYGPFAQVNRMGYNNEDNMTALENGTPNGVSFSYDSSGLLSSIEMDISVATQQHHDEYGYTYRYDKNLKSATSEEAGADITLTYDNNQTLTDIATDYSGGPQATLHYQHDSVGRVTGYTMQAGSSQISVGYKRDKAGRINEIVLPNGQSIELKLTAAGRRSGVIYPNGATTSLNWDSAGRVTQVMHEFSDGAYLQEDYRIDAHNDILAITRTTETGLEWARSMQYDPRNQLNSLEQQSAGAQNDSVTFAYDADRALESVNTVQGENSLQEEYRFGSQSQLTRIDVSDNDEDSCRIYHNDMLGRRTRVSAGQQEWVYQWSAFDQLITAERMTSAQTDMTLHYRYDAFRRLGVKEKDGTKTFYFYDLYNLLAEVAESGEVTWYIFGPGIDDILCCIKDGEYHYYHYIQGRSIAALSDSTGVMARKYDYTPFGREINPDIEDENPWRYNSRYYDRDTGLYQFRLRYYDPESRLYLSRDPYSVALYEPATINRYALHSNNPLGAWDPFGTETSWWDFAGNIFKSLKSNIELAVDMGKGAAENAEQAVDNLNDWWKDRADELRPNKEKVDPTWEAALLEARNRSIRCGGIQYAVNNAAKGGIKGAVNNKTKNYVEISKYIEKHIREKEEWRKKDRQRMLEAQEKGKKRHQKAQDTMDLLNSTSNTKEHTQLLIEMGWIK